MSYYINHPLYTAASDKQILYGLIAFAICEFGNFSIHVLQMNLRPAGSKAGCPQTFFENFDFFSDPRKKVRKIPYPDGNPFTLLFNLVSCPNYTYEIGAWLSFGIMTSCAPGI